MKIEHIHIKYFRTIEDASINMHDITAIVGENNAGKTAILRALNAVMNFEDEEESFLNYNHRFSPRNNTQITITFNDLNTTWRNIVQGEQLTIQFIYRYSSRKKTLYYYDNIGNKINVDDTLTTKLKEAIIYVYIPADRTNKDCSWDNNTIFKKLVTSYVAHHTKNRDAISSYVRKATSQIHSVALKNLEKVINTLYLQNRDVDFNVDFPKGIDYTILLNYVALSMNEYGQNHLLKEWGSGTKSLAIIAMHRAYALLNKCSIILGIEEPEINLHPQAQKRFILSLKEQRHDNETQSIFTTHSTVLIDLLKHEDIVLVRRKSHKRGFASQVTQLLDDFWIRNNIEQFKHYQFFNYKNSDFFFSKYVIIGESKNDCQVFKKLISSEIGNIIADISFVDAGGVNNLIYPFSLLRELNIPFTIVVDKDFFFEYKKAALDNSRNSKTGLPLYKNQMKSNSILNLLFDNEHKQKDVVDANNNGFRTFFNYIKQFGILSMNYCLEMDLTCSTAARNEYYKKLSIPTGDQSQKTLLTTYKNNIKKIEIIDNILSLLSPKEIPESYQKIKKYLIDDIRNKVIA